MSNIGNFSNSDAAMQAYEAAYNEAIAEAYEQAAEAANEAFQDAYYEALEEVDAEVWEGSQEGLNQMADEWMEAYDLAVDTAIAAAQVAAAAAGKPWYCMEDLPPIEIPDIPVEVSGFEVDMEALEDVFDFEFNDVANALIDNINLDFDLSDFLNCITDANDWGNLDEFFDHYFNGNHAPVDLDEIGHGDSIRESDEYEGIIERFGDQIKDSIQQYIIDNDLPNGFTGTFTHNFVNSYSFVGDIFAIGTATISGEFEGTFVIDENGEFTWQGVTEINFSDTFEDPYDIFNIVPGTYDNGDPFEINGQWPENMGGSCP